MNLWTLSAFHVHYEFSNTPPFTSLISSLISSLIITQQCGVNENVHLVFRRCHKSDMLLVAGRQASFFIVLFFISQLFRDNASQQCGAGGDLYSIYQMMLKGHTYKSFKTAPGTLECREACLADVKCQSYNVVMFIAICELNNRSKETRPEHFVKKKDRYSNNPRIRT